MRTKVWYALADAKLGVEYLTLYSLRIRKLRNRYKLAVILTAGIGAGLYKFWEPASLVACILIFGGEWITKLEKQIVMNDVDFIKFGDLKIRYVQLFNKLDRLITDIDDDCLSDDEVKKIYSEIQENKIQIEKLDDELNIPQVKTLEEKAKDITRTFLNNHYS